MNLNQQNFVKDLANAMTGADSSDLCITGDQAWEIVSSHFPPEGVTRNSKFIEIDIETKPYIHFLVHKETRTLYLFNLWESTLFCLGAARHS